MKLRYLSYLFPFIFISCASDPSPYWSFDLTNAKTPVMLTKIETQAEKKKFSFISGTGKLSVTASAQAGNIVNTVTVTSQNKIGDTFDVQVQNIFLQEPVWMLVDKYVLDFSISERLFVSEENRKLTLNISAPTGK